MILASPGGEDGGNIFFFASGEQCNILSTELMSNILWNLHLKISKNAYLQESSTQLESKTTCNKVDQVELCFFVSFACETIDADLYLDS